MSLLRLVDERVYVKRANGRFSLGDSPFVRQTACRDVELCQEGQQRNDYEVLRLQSSKFPNMKELTIKVNAEENKTREKTITATIDPEQFFRIFEGENPRVEIRLDVEDN